ncbi:MAG: Ig-like domain-containing protein [Lachnospiraceae bacterium]|nr:Ig-like domain-containing protein [Lachnospiraceae bacterium]
MRKKLHRIGAGVLAGLLLFSMIPESALAAEDIMAEQIVMDSESIQALTGIIVDDGNTSGDESEPEGGSTSGNETEPEGGSTSGNETEPEDGSTSGNETEPEGGDTSGNEPEQGDGSVSGNEPEQGDGSVSGNEPGQGDGTVSDNEPGTGDESVSDNTIETEDSISIAVESWEEVEQAISNVLAENRLDNKTILELRLVQDFDAPVNGSAVIAFAQEGKKLRFTSDTEYLPDGQTAFVIDADISKITDGSAVVYLRPGANAEIELTNVVLDGGAIWQDMDTLMNNEGTYGRSRILETGGEGTVILGEGCIIENADARSFRKGSALTVASGKTVIEGAVIQNVHSDVGGNIYVQDASLVMKSGEITNNRGKHGAAIWLYDSNGSDALKAEFKMEGGSITYNYAWSKGGAILLDSGKATLNGGTIANNAAGGFSSNDDRTDIGDAVSTGMKQAYGGAVYIGCLDRDELEDDYATLTIDGVTIAENKTLGNTSLGGAIASMAGYGDVVMRSGQLTENKTECLETSDRISGAGIYMYMGSFKMYGGSITHNESAGTGGGISIGDGKNGAVSEYKEDEIPAIVMIYSGDISYNKTAPDVTYSGGGIYRTEGTLRIEGTLIDGSETEGTTITYNDRNGIVIEGTGKAIIENADISHNGDTDGSDGEDFYEENSGLYIVPVISTKETVTLEIKDSNLSDNDSSGMRVAGEDRTQQVLTMDSCTVNRNGDTGVAASQLVLNNCEMCENQNSAVIVLNGSSAINPVITITGGKYNDNFGEYAGAIYTEDTTLTITGTEEAPVEFKRNTASADPSSVLTAGAIAYAGETKLEYCIFEENEALTSGTGAVYAKYGASTITNCTFKNNSAVGSAWGNSGALTLNTSTNSIDNCLFDGNKISIGHGGAIKLMGGTTNISNSVITNNYADSNGGGIACRMAGLSLSNVTITGNHSGIGGAAIHNTIAYELYQETHKIKLSGKVVIADNISDKTGQESNIFIDRFGGYKETDCYEGIDTMEEKLAYAPIIIEGALTEDSKIGVAIDREDAYQLYSDDNWDSATKYVRDYAFLYGTENYTVTEADMTKFYVELPEYQLVYDAQNRTAWYKRFTKNYLAINGDTVLFDDVLTQASGEGWSYDADSNTLELHNFTGRSIQAGMDTLHLNLTGNNTIGTLLTEEAVKKQWDTVRMSSRSIRYLYDVPFYVQRILQDGDTFAYTDDTNGNLVINGAGTLCVYGTEYASVIDGKLTQNSGTFSSTSYHKGLFVGNGIEVNDATLEGYVKALDLTVDNVTGYHSSNYIPTYARGIHTYRMLKISDAIIKGIVEDRKTYSTQGMPTMGIYVDKHTNGTIEPVTLAGGQLVAQAGTSIQLSPSYDNNTNSYLTKETEKLSFGFGSRSDVNNYGTNMTAQGATSAFVLGTDASITHKANTIDALSDLIWTLKAGADAETAQTISNEFATVSIVGVSGYPTKENFAFIAGEDVKYIEATTDHSLVLRSISLDPTRMNLKIGETASLTVSYLPIDAENKEVTYTSNNTNVVVVTTGNVLKAMGRGTAVIRVTSKENSRIFAECVVKVIGDAKDFKLNTTAVEGTVGEEVDLSLTPVPVEDDISQVLVTWTSSDATVATVEGDGMNAIVHPLAAGNVQITATVTDVTGSFVKTYTCNAAFKKKLTEEEIVDLAADLDPIHIVTNKSNSLGDVSFTKNGVTVPGWSFRKDAAGEDVVVTASDKKPVQKFTAYYTAEDIYPIEVELGIAVTQITGVSIDMDDNGILEKTGNVTEIENATIQVKTIGAEIAPSDWLEVNWSVSNDKIAISNTTGFAIPVTPVDKGAATLNAHVAVIGRTVSKKNITEFETSKKLEVISQTLMDAIILEPRDAGAVANAVSYTKESEAVLIDAKDITSTSNQLEIAVKGDGNELARTAYNVKSSDTKVAKAIAQDGKIVITMKEAGVSVITVTARDKGKAQKQIVIYAKDYAPYMPSTDLTMNRYNEIPLVFGLAEANGNTVNSVQIYEKPGSAYETTPSVNFEIVKYQDAYAIGLKTASELRQISQDAQIECKLVMTTKRGIYEQPVKITVSTKKPSVKLQQIKKANTFYRGAEAVYILDATTKIESATFTPNGDSHGAVFYGEYNPWTHKMVFNTYNGRRYTLTKENLEFLTLRRADGRTGTLTIHYEGYSEEADTVMELEIGIENKPISVVTTPSVSAIYKNADILESEITFLDKTTNKKVVVTDVTTDAAGASVYGTNASSRTIKYHGNRNSASISLRLWNNSNGKDAWTTSIGISHKVKNLPAPEIVLSEKKVTLNTAITGRTVIDVTLKNDIDKIAAITFADPANAKVKVLEEQYITPSFDVTKQVIYLRVDPSAPAGRYDIQVDAQIQENGRYVECKQIKLPITISSKAPAVKLGVKGKIDVLDRANTVAVYTPKFAEITGKVKRVRLVGAYATKFDATIEDGKILLTAKANAEFSTKNIYKIVMALTLDNGYEVVSPVVKVKVTQSKPALITSAAKVTMYRKVPDYSRGYIVKTKAKNYVIEDVVLTNYTDDFTYDVNTHKLTLKNGSTLKAGTYKLKFKVIFRGEAINTKDFTTTLNVVVK